jgi:hypothetical protein
MSWTAGLWFMTGLLTGAVHLILVWRAAQPPFRSLVAGVLRLLGVAVLLVGAALMGHLVAAACGWSGGFVLSAVGAYVWKA